MSMSEAIAAIAAPGSPFEVQELDVNGVTNRVFVNAPATLRDVFNNARTNEATFLVYEDEEWSFADVMLEADAVAYALVHTF